MPTAIPAKPLVSCSACELTLPNDSADLPADLDALSSASAILSAAGDALPPCADEPPAPPPDPTDCSSSFAWRLALAVSSSSSTFSFLLAIVHFLYDRKRHDVGEVFLSAEEHQRGEGDFPEDLAEAPAVGFRDDVDGRGDPAVVALGVFF